MLPKNIAGDNVRVTCQDGLTVEGDCRTDTRLVDLPGPEDRGVLLKWPDGASGRHASMYIPEADIQTIDVFGPAIYAYE